MNRLQRCLDVSQGPTLACSIIALGGDEYIFFVVHHLVVDLVSWRVFLGDLEALYRGSDLLAKTTSFKSWASQVEGYASQLSESKWPQPAVKTAVPHCRPHR